MRGAPRQFAKVISCDHCVGYPKILRDDHLNLPQPGYIGSNYQSTRVLLVGENPAISDNVVEDRTFAEALAAVRDTPNRRTMSELKQIQDKTMPYWDIVRDYFPLDESGLQLDDIAYVNVVRCRMHRRPNGDYFEPGSDIVEACIGNHFVSWLDWLKPRVVVCIGKWAHSRIVELLEERGIDNDSISRERSLPRQKRREDQKRAAALIRGNTEQGIRRMNKKELAILIERKELDIGNPSKQKLAKLQALVIEEMFR